jgi:hypothetical protein
MLVERRIDEGTLGYDLEIRLELDSRGVAMKCMSAGQYFEGL